MEEEDFQKADRAIRGAIRASSWSQDYADIYQHCWLELLRVIHKFHRSRDVGKFAFQVARFHYGLYMRKLKRREGLMKAQSLDPLLICLSYGRLPPSSLTEESEMRIWEAIDALPESLASVFLENVLAEKALVQVAQDRGLTFRAVKTGVARTRYALRKSLAGIR